MSAASPARASGAHHLSHEQAERLRHLLQELAAEKRALLHRLAEIEGEEQLVAATREALDDVDAALVRFEAGTYGACESCGRPIPWERLEAVPDARFCIGCPRPRGVFG